jgi:hypothetical protein
MGFYLSLLGGSRKKLLVLSFKYGAMILDLIGKLQLLHNIGGVLRSRVKTILAVYNRMV